MQFVNNNQQNLLWQHIALKIIIAMIVESAKQRGCCVIISVIRIFGKCARTCIELQRLLCCICESKTKNAE